MKGSGKAAPSGRIGPYVAVAKPGAMPPPPAPAAHPEPTGVLPDTPPVPSDASSDMIPDDDAMGENTSDMVDFSRSLVARLQAKAETQIAAINDDMTKGIAELGNEMDKQWKATERRHRQLQDKVSAVEHKLDGGMANITARMAGLEAQLKASADSQAESIAKETFSAMLYFPFSVTPAHKKQRFARIHAEHLSGELRTDAVPKYDMSATTMRIEFSTKDRMHSFVDSFPGRTYSYVDKDTSERVSVNVGVSRSQPRRAVGAAFRPFYQILEKHGYTRDTISQRFRERDGEWINVVMLAQKGGRAAEIGTFHFEFDGLRAVVSKYDPKEPPEELNGIVAELGELLTASKDA